MSAYIALTLALLALPGFAGAGNNTPAPDVNALIAQANARLAAGEAPAAVEAALTKALSGQGAKVEREPASWDVYAIAHWRQAREGFTVAVESQPTGSHEQETGLLRPNGDLASENDALPGRTGGAAASQRSAPVVHFSDPGRLDAQGAAVVAPGLPDAGQPQPQKGGSRLRKP